MSQPRAVEEGGYGSDNDSLATHANGDNRERTYRKAKRAEVHYGSVGDDEVYDAGVAQETHEQQAIEQASQPEGGRAFNSLRVLALVLGVLVALAFAVASGGRYYLDKEGVVSNTFSDSLTDSTSTSSSTITTTSTGEEEEEEDDEEEEDEEEEEMDEDSSSYGSASGEGYVTENDDITYNNMSDDDKQTLFDVFLTTYGKGYTPSETELRFEKFKANLEIIDQRNAAERANGGTAVHGITKFSDLSDEEFKSVYLTATPPAEPSTATLAKVPPYTGTDDLVNWYGIYTDGIKDQGYCGSCWAFSVTEQMQADAIRLGMIGFNVTLATQQIVSCDTESFGCGGGWTERAYQYIQQAGGVALEDDYPYISYYDMTGVCKEDSSTFYMSLDGYYTINSEQSMIDYVKSTGPLSVCVDATEWASYVKGVVSVCGSDVDHCVQIVGIDTSSNNGYWLVRNSWGSEWGEGGYIRISVGNDTCAISNDPTFSKPVLMRR